MSARFDHLVVAVEDLDDAMARWTAAGLPAARGGAHPVGTVNALVRGPGPAYVELIAPGSDESNPWLDRVRSARGPISRWTPDTSLLTFTTPKSPRSKSVFTADRAVSKWLFATRFSSGSVRSNPIVAMEKFRKNSG